MTAAKHPVQKLIIFVSLFAFIGSVGYSALQMVSNIQSAEQANAATSEQAAAKKNELKSLQKSYQQVLQREPNNETALQGLASAHWQLGERKEAISIIENLVQAHPQQEDYKEILAEAKQKNLAAQQ
jgi:thioredoxin-like negative regulator of GroEL